MKKIFETTSPEETEQVGEWLAHQLQGTEVIAFSGGLGMGKTAFVRGLARGLGIRQEVTSPTFALVHQYEGGAFPLYHFDMYRVTSWDDLYSTGFFDYLGNGVLAIEWSENIRSALDEPVVEVDISPGTQDDARHIRVQWAENAQS